MSAVAVAIAVVAVLFRDRVSLRAFGIVTAIGLAIYGAFWMSIYGTPTGLGVYGGVPEDAAFNPLQALAGLLVDRAYGVFPVAPVFFLAIAFAGIGRSNAIKREWIAEVLLVLAILLPVSFWRMWWGGQSPPARLIAPMMPVLALWFARAFAVLGASSAFRVATTAMLAWSWFLFLFAALNPGGLLFINKRTRPTRLWDALWPGGPLDGLLPDLARPEASDWTLAAVWVVLLAGTALALRAWAKKTARA
jgi:hypothetical protein